MPFVSEAFKKYISPDCDRAEFIQSYLAKRGVQSVDINLEGKKHIYVKFPVSQYNSQFKLKTVIAHYDRAPNSPGANDNSAADFCIMDWAVRLSKMTGKFHNVRILFTDGEELGDNGVTEQGSFAIASIFRRLGLTNDDVYVFDCVGRGDVPVIGKNSGLTAPAFSFKKKLSQLENRIEKIFRAAKVENWLTLPLSYSDNAGFVALGIPAVAITMLPKKEADLYMKALAREKKLEAYVLRRAEAGCFGDSKLDALERTRFETMIPETWRMFHTNRDSSENLTEESFSVMAKILDVLAEEKTPAV